MAHDGDILRRQPRLKERHTMLVRSLKPLKGESLHLCCDFSIGGCCFESGRAFGVGATLEILLTLEKRVIMLPSRVVRELPFPGGKYRVGVLFTTPGDREMEMLESLFALEDFSMRSRNRYAQARKSAVA